MAEIRWDGLGHAGRSLNGCHDATRPILVLESELKGQTLVLDAPDGLAQASPANGGRDTEGRLRSG